MRYQNAPIDAMANGSADSSYVIDIAASMPAGDVTLAQLDALTEKLMGGGKNADHFQQAIQKVSTSLDAAKVASLAANEALSAGQEEYRTLERAALQAAKAAEKAGRKAGGVVPDDLAAKAVQTSAAVNAYAGTLGKLESEAKGAAAAETELGRTLANTRKLSDHSNKALAQQAERLSKMRGALGNIGGPLGRLGQQAAAPVHAFSELSATIGATRAAALIAVVGIAAVSAAIVAVTAAAVAGAVAIAAWAVRLADGARSAGLAREAAEQLTPELAAIRGDIDALSKGTGLGDVALRKLATGLLDAKVSAEDLPVALRAAALAEAALGEGGSAKFVADLKKGKLAVKDFAKQTQDSFGGIVARKMLGLDAQTAQLKKNFAGLFSGLNIEPVLDAMSKLVAMFDETSVIGATLKFLFETIFQPIINQAEKAFYFVEAFMLGMLIGFTKVYIALKPTIRAIKDFFGFEDTSLEDTLASVTKAAEYVAFALVGVGAAVAAVTVVVSALATAALAVGGAIMLLPLAIDQAIKAVVKFLASVNFAELGTNILKSLAAGITGAAGFVVSAVKSAISAAIKSAKALLGIASPSKVFAGLGENTGESFAGAVEDTAPAAHAAMQELTRVPEAPASALVAQDARSDAPAAAAPAAAPGASVDMSGATFNFYGVQGAEDAEARFSELLTRVLEGDAIQAGA